ncbi:putative Ubiquitin-like domain-containing protein [Helianthus annuus]|nr:putative Ubiquitin-like domain-containing protein [Helianthus annuus]KAJ0745944.1 putative Ubiquitin-like domain-containing protein [Helianthus annuus]
MLLVICLFLQMLLCIRTTTGTTFTFKVGRSDTFDLVKAKIEDICSLDNRDLHWELIPKPEGWWRGGMPIFVRILNGKTFTLSIQSDQKISSLQYWIMKKEDIPGYRQKLFLAGMSLQVGDHTLAHYNIVAGSTLDLVVNGKQVAPNAEISVETACGKNFPVVVNYDLLIEDVKKLIEDKVHIPLKQQRLVYDGVELEDTRLLRSYDFQEKDTFWLVIDDASMEMKTRVSMRIQIQVSATKKTIHLDVGSTDTIHDVKAKIQAREHIPTGQQVLFLPVRRLYVDAFTLDDYFIQNGSTLYLAQILGETLLT